MEDDEMWPALGSDGTSNHLPQQSWINQDSSSKDDNYVKAKLIHVDYPKLNERLRDLKSISDTHSHILNIRTKVSLRHRSISDGNKLKMMKGHKRTDKIHINLQEIIESAITTAKIHCKNGHATISTRDTAAKILKHRLVKNKEETRKRIRIKPFSPHNKEMQRIFQLMKTYKSDKSRPCVKAQKSETVTQSADDIDLNALKLTSDTDMNYRERFAALSFSDKNHGTSSEHVSDKSSIVQPDLLSVLNNLNISKTEKPDIQRLHFQNSFGSFQSNIEDEVIEKTRHLGISTDNEAATSNSGLNAKIKFSRNFREYCTNTVTKSLNQSLEKFLNEILRFQKKLHNRDSNKARYKRRYYAGLREVQKHVEFKKIKFVVIAPDLEKVQFKDGLEDQVRKLLRTCEKSGVTVCFGSRRRKLGYFTYGRGFASCIGITNYGGAEEHFKNVLVELLKARNEFKKLNNNSEGIINLANIISENDFLSDSINALRKALC